MKLSRFIRFFDIAFLVLLCVLCIGTPLLFTSLTRSVFEVNKLLLLRLDILLVYALWLFRYLLLKDNGQDHSQAESYSVFGLRWKKIGLEIPFVIWLIFNLISTVFSQNIYIAIIGAYDRWEGIITIFNYAALVFMFAKLIKDRVQLQWVLWSLIVPAVLSAIYGIFQSLGVDFMNWSVDPTKRVFACINNPVHFCAYMGMLVPVSLGFLLLLSKKKAEAKNKLKYQIGQVFLIVSTILIYYAQFLSFSRATWIGFVVSMPVFYLLVTDTFNQTSKKRFFSEFWFFSIAMFTFYLIDIFKVAKKSMVLLAPLLLVIGAYLVYQFFLVVKTDRLKNGLMATGLLAAIVVGYIISPTVYAPYLAVATTGLILAFAWKGPEALKQFFIPLFLVLLFSKLMYVVVSLSAFFECGVLALAYGWIGLKRRTTLLKEQKYILFLFLLIFSCVIFIPGLPAKIASFSNQKPVDELDALVNVNHRVKAYDVSSETNPRVSMWKSAIPWVRDYWLLGSGPDTIKYMYPVYRRTEYGILEGGHNFTPDRLHNEYINTLATRGVTGFLIYYLGIILGWYILVLKGFFDFKHNPNRFILAGLISGAGIYLGQVIFNFGVVATLVLFYTLIGLGIAVAKNPTMTQGDAE
ncbi:MAG: O-antigen ligase family protein [Candidatus Margulisiibacteriota bacterium]